MNPYSSPSSDLKVKAEEYTPSFLKLYLAFSILYLICWLCAALVEILVFSGLPITAFFENREFFFRSLWPKTVLSAAIAPPLAALFVRWSYKGTLTGHQIICRNTLGLKVKLSFEELVQIKKVAIPLVPILKLRSKSHYWSAWVTEKVYEKLPPPNKLNQAGTPQSGAPV